MCPDPTAPTIPITPFPAAAAIQLDSALLSPLPDPLLLRCLPRPLQKQSWRSR